MKLSIAKIGSFFRDTHRDESGAVALLCLAALIAVMMIGWMIFDAHKSTKDKVMLQGAADTAAFSHASVEARSMNMISYANIAKRSIYGIHSLYPGMFAAYTVWLAGKVADCLKIPPNIAACVQAGWNAPMWAREAIDDHSNYSGDPLRPYLMAGLNGISKIVNYLGKIGVDFAPSSMAGGNSKNAHLEDMKALNNYQHYTHHITPWWGWSEQLSRGWRNGATTVASFPPPPGRITISMSSIQSLINSVNGFLSSVGGPTIDMTVFRGNDNLPIEQGDYGPGTWGCHMLLGQTCSDALDSLGSFSLDEIEDMGNESYIAEHLVNTALHYKESERGARSAFVMATGPTLFFATVGLLYSDAVLSDYSDPWVLDAGGSEGEWLKRTSNLVFAYHHDGDRFEGDRSKYELTDRDYKHTFGSIEDYLYQSNGYWTMSKSEITFNGEHPAPDMWHPSWTARMRPVHLPGEFDDAGYDMNDAFNQAAPYLALTAQVSAVTGGGTSAITDSIQDLLVMGLSSAAMGPSTVDGIGK